MIKIGNYCGENLLENVMFVERIYAYLIKIELSGKKHILFLVKKMAQELTKVFQEIKLTSITI